MRLTGHARLAGIMGWPVGHSRSPALHGYWLGEHGIDGAYVPLPVQPDRLEQALRGLPALGFRGCNLTLPHKQAALAIVDRVEPVARRIGAINTIVVGEDGSLEGRNTDAYGFREHLRESVAEWDTQAGPAVVLGAGGAARAVVAALEEAGVPEIRLVNRTRSHAEALARDLADAVVRLTVTDWDSRALALRGCGILVNTTSLGMDGQPALDLDLGGLPAQAVVVDIVYAPLETALLAAARRQGHRVVDGLGMLLHQGRPGFEAWFGVPVRVTPGLRAAILATLAPAR
ncbi:MAG TPA: shikimate dehydrogenase [Stellaceae bacterium]|jgi:shikimate dehydrogenase|nr:shikimate dehydrogenase [Stellaceae bacterium]